MPNESTPFVGPRPFTREDAPLFFGRTDEANELLSLVVAEREVLLYAQSGAGKTSLLNAGLRPVLEKEAFEVLPLARVRGELPDDLDPTHLANVYIFNVLAGWSALLGQVRRVNTTSLADFLNELPPQLDKEGFAKPRLLIFDQFEELFTFYPERASDRRGFFEQVRDALEQNRILRVIFAMREEYIAELTPYAAILPEKLRTRFRLEQLREPAALEAVTGPLTHSRFSFAPSVAEKLVSELLQVNLSDKAHPIRGEYVEPVQLQVVCDALCRRLPPNTSVITQDHLQTFGDVDEALANFYKDCLKQTTWTTHVRRARLRRWFGKTLITPEGVRDTVRQGPTKTGGLPNRAVRKLEELHLIRGEERPGRGRWYELIHDTFIRPIREVNRIVDRRKHLFQGLAASAALMALVTASIGLNHAREQERHARERAKERVRLYKEVIALMARGSQFAKDGKHEAAVKQFEKALEVDPLNRAAHVEAAASHSMLGHYDQAVSHYQKALEIKSDVPVHVALGRLYLERGTGLAETDATACFDEAEAEMSEASKLDPASPDPYQGRGDIEVSREQQRKGQKYFDAETYYLVALNKNPDWQDAYIGLAYVHLYRGEADEAIRDAQKGVELGLGQAAPHTVLGQAFFWKGMYNQAAAEYNRAIGLKSTDYESHSRLGDVYYIQRNYDLAKIEYEQALNLAKSSEYDLWIADASCSLGNVALKQYKGDVAYDRFREALDLDPDNSSAHFGVGLLFAFLKRPKDAQAHWNEDLKLCKGTDPVERMERVIYEVALGRDGTIAEMRTILSKEHPPVGMMLAVFDDADSLVTFKIHAAESKKLRDMLVEAIKGALKEPAREE